MLCIVGRLQVIPCGIAAVPRLRKHPWMKGWPNVISDVFQSKISCVRVTPYAQVGSFDGEPLTAMLGHACILVGLSVGYADRATVPPHTHWFEDHEVETNRRRIPTIRHLQPRSPVYVPVDTRRPPQDIPVATTIPARPPFGTHVPPGLFPGLPLTRVHPHGPLRTPHPPLAPGPHAAHRISGLADGGSGLRQCKGGGGRCAGSHGRAHGRAGGCPAALAGWLLMVWGSWVVYYARSPDHQQPSRKCPRCFSTTASVKITT